MVGRHIGPLTDPGMDTACLTDGDAEPQTRKVVANMEPVTEKGPSGRVLPMIVTRNFVLFEGRSVPLVINRAQSVAAAEAAAVDHDHQVIIVAQRRESGDGGRVGKDDSYMVGALARIERKTGDKKRGYQLLVTGLERVHLANISDERPYLMANYTEFPDTALCDEATKKALLANARILSKEILALIPGDTSQIETLLEAVDDLSGFLPIVVENLDVPLDQKQAIMSMDGERSRVLRVLELMAEQKKSLEIQADVRSKLSEKLGKHQREAILREQIKTIRDELGETRTETDEDYIRRVQDANLPDAVRSVAMDEAKRLESIGSSSPEAHIVRNYLDLILALPWHVSTEDSLDLEHARAVLNADHFGLEKIKKRIIQHLAVMKLKKDKRGSILLFVGPPGVGKTSLGESIARALGRKFVRAALGGVRDDAEIRGHRKTYIGAMPGRVLQSIKRVGVNNPVFLLDEIDKLGRGYSGDPASALLEVLDPEQNKEFVDHYLDVPFDLSQVFFIATANSLDSIPGPLLDRMEVIDLSGYVTAEKLAIAKTYLVPKQVKEHGLTADQVSFTDSALLKVISGYTREAGVRGLQRQIQTLCRYAAERIADGTVLALTIAADQVTQALGAEKYSFEETNRVVPPGVVTGLAWTPVGGDILFVEAAQMPGSGRLILTGQLGDVMKESAQIALSLVRSHLAVFLKVSDFDKRDLHIHVPSGAIPKDGPSAGVTMLTTMASLLTGFRVSPKLAMTGEITLRGQVTPVGGIKEKLLAAHRSGVEHVLIPKKNEKDLTDVPSDVLSEMKVTLVEHVNEVLEIALGIHDAFLPTVATGQLPAAAPVIHG
jgi:ATP-dependent Lon protease